MGITNRNVLSNTKPCRRNVGDSAPGAQRAKRPHDQGRPNKSRERAKDATVRAPALPLKRHQNQEICTDGPARRGKNSVVRQGRASADGMGGVMGTETILDAL